MAGERMEPVISVVICGFSVNKTQSLRAGNKIVKFVDVTYILATEMYVHWTRYVVQTCERVQCLLVQVVSIDVL